MNMLLTSGHAPAESMVALGNGFRRFERLAMHARRVATGLDGLRTGSLPDAQIDAGPADALGERRPVEISRQRLAILAGDIAGYSRLIEADDVGTVARLRWLRRELFDPAAASFGAGLIRHTADAVLLAFADPVDAIGCALTLQSVLFLLNEDLPDRQSLRLRIGFSVGEVLLVDGDIHGTGVNIAARLEGLAGAGEICLCERALGHVQHALPPVFEPLGERRLHNISTPIRTYRIALEVIARLARQRLAGGAEGEIAALERGGARCG